jgi:acid phosphatase family membrane protein YuiD
VLRDSKGKRRKSVTQAKADARMVSKLQKESLKVHGDPPGHSEEGPGKRKKGK